MSKIELKEVRLQVTLPQNGFRKFLYFNGFQIQREQELCLIQFGLTAGQLLLDSYACVLTPDALEQNETSLLEYLDRTGRPAAKAPAWKAAKAPEQIDVVDVFGMSFRENLAETCLFVFSMHAAARSKADVQAEPLALLRSTRELQKQFIVALYEQ